MTHDKIIKAVHKGILTANRDYETWSDGAWLIDNGIEGFMVAAIAHALKKEHKNGFLTLEQSFSQMAEDSGAKAKPGQLPGPINGNFRADLVLRNSNYKPIIVLEVKRVWERSRCLKDLERLYTLVDRYGQNMGGSLQFGLLTFFLVENSMPRGQTIVEQQKKIKKQTREAKFLSGSNLVQFISCARGYHMPKALEKRYESSWYGCPFSIKISSRRK
jgi:hypothetical protein